MKYKILGKTDLKVSELGFGCQSLGGGLYHRDDKESIRTLQKAFDYGINFYDVSDHHSLGNSEKLLGKAFKDRRDKVILTSKAGLMYSQAGIFALKMRSLARPISSFLQPIKNSLHYFRATQLHFNYSDDYITQAVEKMRKVLSTMNFPRDYAYDFSGDYEKTVRNQKQFSFAILLTIVLIYLVLASLFESYMQPVLIMFAIPLSIIGVALLLWITKKSISLGVWIGIMILFGRVVNGSIILVEKINTRRHGKNTILKPLIGSCKERFQSISITTTAIVLGLIPMIISKDEASDMWKSLALTVVGGEITGTTLTLFLVPMAYLNLDKLTNYLTMLSDKLSKQIEEFMKTVSENVMTLIKRKKNKIQPASSVK